MTEHTMQLKNRYYVEIASGAKRYEARLYDDKRRNLRLLDTIRFTNVDTNESVVTTIVELSYFKTFRDGLNSKDFAYVLPGISTIDEAEQIYTDIYGDKERDNGVIFIKLQINK